MELLTDLADEWLLTLGTVSEQTRTVYARGVTQFAAWLADASPGTSSTPARSSAATSTGGCVC